MMGLPLPTLIVSELITMTVTVTDPDFNFLNSHPKIEYPQKYSEIF